MCLNRSRTLILKKQQQKKTVVDWQYLFTNPEHLKLEKALAAVLQYEYVQL